MRLEVRQRMLKKWREPNRPEELTGESADKRAAARRRRGEEWCAESHRQHRQANEAPPVPSSPRQQQQQPRPRQYQQQQPKQPYNNNAIIELDLDDDAPDEVEIIPNTQIHTDNDSLDGEDVTVDEQMETVEEEEEEEKEKKRGCTRETFARKHVILTSSEEQTQGTQMTTTRITTTTTGYPAIRPPRRQRLQPPRTPIDLYMQSEESASPSRFKRTPPTVSGPTSPVSNVSAKIKLANPTINERSCSVCSYG